MEIRNPDKTHLPALLALLERCFPGRWSAEEVADRIFYDEHYDPNHVWMAREQGRMLGFAHTLQRGARAWLKLVAVDPDHRRRGIGRDLLSRAEFRLSGEGAREIRVESLPPHEFLPGPAPRSGEAAFLEAQGYLSQGEDEALFLPPLDRSAPPPMGEAQRREALAWARGRCGESFGWAEEALACRPAKAVFDPDAGLCLAEPGLSLGPLWSQPGVEAPRLKALASAAWALAGSRPPRHALGLRLWQVPGSGALPSGLAQGEAYLNYLKTLA